MTKYCQTLLKSVASKATAAGKQDKELVVINIVSSLPPPSFLSSLSDPSNLFARINETTDRERYILWPTSASLRLDQAQIQATIYMRESELFGWASFSSSSSSSLFSSCLGPVSLDMYAMQS